MKTMKTFLADNWHFLVSGVLLLILATLMGCVFRPSTGCCWFMVLTFIFFGIATIGSDYKCSMVIFVASFLLMWLFCWLGWNYFTLLVPIAILAINAVVADAPGPMVIMIIVFAVLSLAIIQENEQLNEAKCPEYAIEGVITEITKRDHNDIMVVLETKEGITIIPFRSTVEDAWRLEKGDTISFNVYNDMIVAFEKK